uniref:modulator of smoothened protein isoform X2 n=1 Tax=Myxine glutinosa TaxID=7769 RepID=UPI00358FF2C8
MATAATYGLGWSAVRAIGVRPCAMDKLTAVSGLLFLVADALALASLAHPEWLRSIDVPSGISLGLLQRCVAIRGRLPICGTPDLPATWAISLGMIGAAVAGLTAACGLTAFAFWRQRAALYARWVAFGADCSFDAERDWYSTVLYACNACLSYHPYCR